MTPLEGTNELLAKTLNGAKCPVLWISGGKDSLCLAHLARPWRTTLTLLHVALDDGWPGQSENLRTLAQEWGFRLVELPPGIRYPEYVALFGHPVNVVPTAMEGDRGVMPSPWRTGPVKVSAWTQCQTLRLIKPLHKATQLMQADVVLTGSRASDGPFFAAMGTYFDARPLGLGWERYNPLTDWTTDAVYAYLDAQGVPLPPLYQWKRQDGHLWEYCDCLSCTWKPQHWAFLRQHLPDEYAKRWPTVAPVYEALEAAMRDELTQQRVLKKEDT
jgi:3'-phosphoadenosine 5'-phosphosulfate sulfotransferase (PAPS reductase)/FAD synthetase